MVTITNYSYKDYLSSLMKIDKLSKDINNLTYSNFLLEKQNEELKLYKENTESILLEKENLIQAKDNLLKEKDFEIAKLRALLNIDGTNHGIPTSQTPIHKKKVIPNTREKSNLPKGAQKGHKKHKLERFSDDEINQKIQHVMESCPCCNSNSIKQTGNIKEKDELDYRIIVEKKRHSFFEYECKDCGNKFHQNIPNNLKEENQYGPQVQALELTLINQANVTINKAQKITFGLTNGQIDLSEGFISKLQKRAANRLNDFIEELKIEIIKQPLIHWDDTVIMIDKHRSCLRFYGTENLALYTTHLKKNKEGIDKDGILSFLPKETIVEHDHNSINYNKKYFFTNAECNRHLISALKNVIDNLHHNWPKKLIELLTKTNNKRKRLIEKGIDEFPQEQLNNFESKFAKIMLQAISENKKEKELGKYYAGNENVLIRRILDYKNEYFLWIYDFNVPFTNNLSERSLRGVKSKQKASGQFLNIETATWYSKIKSYIETCTRNGVNVYNALLMLCLDTPYSLQEILSGKLKDEESSFLFQNQSE